MGEHRPKLWVVAEGALTLQQLRDRLGDLADIHPITPDQLHSAPIDHAADLVLTLGHTTHRPAPIPDALPGGPTADALRAVESLPLGVAIADPQGRIAWANARYRSLPQPVRDRIAELGQHALATLAAARATRQPDHAAATVRAQVQLDDAAFDVALSAAHAALLPDAASAPTDLSIVVRDITAERRLQLRLDAIDQAGASLVSFPADTIRKVNAAERLRLLETRIVQACRDLLRFDHFLIRVLDDRSGRLEMIMHSGLPQEAVELEIRPGIESNGISGYVAATGKSYICADTQTDRRFLPGFSNARSSLTVPLRLHDKVIGVFNVESDRVSAFTDDDRQFAEIFSRYVAIALHMLNLLVVERSATSETFSGRVEGELSAPLEDILAEADWLKDLASRDPEAARHLQRIVEDVSAIRARVRNVAAGAQTLLGVEGALRDVKTDPILQGKSILVADDEANIRRIIHDVLHNRGASVATFPSGSEAIAALEDAAAGKRPPFDAVLSDIRMPDRNGYEVFAAARKAFPGVPVILMTGFGYDPHHSIVRASQEGLQNVLFKPFPVDRLLDELRKAVTPKTGT